MKYLGLVICIFVITLFFPDWNYMVQKEYIKEESEKDKTIISFECYSCHEEYLKAGDSLTQFRQSVIDDIDHLNNIVPNAN